MKFRYLVLLLLLVLLGSLPSAALSQVEGVLGINPELPENTYAIYLPMATRREQRPLEKYPLAF